MSQDSWTGPGTSRLFWGSMRSKDSWTGPGPSRLWGLIGAFRCFWSHAARPWALLSAASLCLPRNGSLCGWLCFLKAAVGLAGWRSRIWEVRSDVLLRWLRVDCSVQAISVTVYMVTNILSIVCLFSSNFSHSSIIPNMILLHPKHHFTVVIKVSDIKARLCDQLDRNALTDIEVTKVTSDQSVETTGVTKTLQQWSSSFSESGPRIYTSDSLRRCLRLQYFAQGRVDM